MIVRLSRIMKHSKKRQEIISIFEKGDLFTATEVCEKLPEIDRATIYRNLSMLSHKGILREVNVKKGISSFELNRLGDYHQHFICEDCEKITPVDVDIEKIKSILPKGIEFQDFELNLKGVCPECK